MARSKGAKSTSDAQRRKIAKARVSGKSTAEIAREMGKTDRNIRQILADRRTQTHILHFKSKADVPFARMWLSMLRTMEDDLESKDFNERATARAQFLRVLTAGDPPLQRVGDVGSSGGDITLEEIVSVLRQKTA